MLVNGKHYESIWLDGNDNPVIRVIDQRKLPFRFEIAELRSVEDTYEAIREMIVRGAPLIGATAAFGIYLSTLEITSKSNIRDHINNAARYLISSRPTAVNLPWAVNHVLGKIDFSTTLPVISKAALDAALEICEAEKENCRRIGFNGLRIIRDIAERKKGQPVNILTHCNAGWLACIDYGTATSPIYLANEKGLNIHVWVDETRPRNQGSKLTAWELGQNNIRYTIIADNTGGHLMQHGMVDAVMVGCDRATAGGDVANKIGTYLKALAAHDNNVPFYAVLPSTSIDFSINDGLKEIKVEERDPSEVTEISGLYNGEEVSVRICPDGASAVNYGFDVTPSRLVTALITEKGVCTASREGLRELFPEKFC
ncbi:MAG TPA: S-methyl-5-thioribose-1-phosphate isomerase [Bacteroidales bacterium]|nr:S-methyl-5-thioribose-1-phosphate isomerase [Bacteroidales bacterium]